MAQRYVINPVRKQSILFRRVSTVWGIVAIAVAATIVVVMAKMVLNAAIIEVSNTYGPIYAAPCAEEYFEYEVKESGGEQYAAITGYNGSLREVNIPPEIDGFEVREISRFAFMSDETVYTVRIPEGVSFIGNMCFFNCTSLRRVYVPETAIDIGGWCFGKTQNLVVEGITASYAEEYCEKLNIDFEGLSYGTNGE